MTFFRRWRALWNPGMYHGWNRKRSYFEGWYFKVVDPSEKWAFAFIPGISMDASGDTHAFIQVFDGIRNQAYYHRFEPDAFKPHPAEFSLQLENNFFSPDLIRLDLPDLKAELRFSGLHPWPKRLDAPGIMGWYSFVPFMECYHGVISVFHQLQGSMQFKGQTINFDGGIGYMEKDWGVSFPNSWIWLQTNHFHQDSPVSLMASVARIPWLGNAFNGYIAGFLWKGKIHRFATYTGAEMQAAFRDKSVFIAFRDKRYRLEIQAFQAEGTTLRSPISGQMTGKVNESLQAKVEVRFFENELLVFAGTGDHAGLEIAGPVEELLSDTWKK